MSCRTGLAPLPLVLALLAALAAGGRSAAAQPPPSPDPGGSPAPQPPPGGEPEGASAGEAGEPITPADPPALDATYDRAFEALVSGRFDAAIAGFDEVALGSTDPERRAASRELSRLARTLQERQARLVLAAPPPGAAPVAPPGIPEDDRPGAGRVEVVVSSTLASFYAGWTLAVLFDADDFQTAALVITGTTAVGFLGSFYGSAGRDITGGMAESYSLGLGLGAANGLLLASPLGAEGEDAFLSIGLAGAALGGTTALLLADRARPTRAQASFASTLSILGIATTGLGLAIVQPDDIGEDSVLLLLAGGLDAGAATGIALAPRLDWSKSRARLVGLSLFLGALAGVGGSAIFVGEPETDSDGRAYAAATLAGMWGGFGLGVHLTRDMQPDPRFAREQAPTAHVIPTAVEGGMALSLAGTF